MIKNKILWISGISGVGKTTIAQVLKKKIKRLYMDRWR